MNRDIEKSVEVLKSGGIIIFPTDTAFGIGCRIDNKKSVKKLVKIRGRSRNQPLPILVNSFEMAKKYLKTYEEKKVLELVKKYWPGGLTIVLPCKKEINSVIRGNGSTLGIRMPDHKLILEIIKEVGVPIIGCSANFPGDKTPFALQEVNKELTRSVDFVLDGKCFKRQSSTVIDCSTRPWEILRQGAVEVKQGLREIRLIIDTSSNKYISVGLKINDKKFSNKKKIDFQKAQAVLPMIDKILKDHDLSLDDLTSVKVNEGPGSFTGLRVGVSVANTLGHFLKIPINNKKHMKLASVTYE